MLNAIVILTMALFSIVGLVVGLNKFLIGIQKHFKIF